MTNIDVIEALTSEKLSMLSAVHVRNPSAPFDRRAWERARSNLLRSARRLSDAQSKGRALARLPALWSALWSRVDFFAVDADAAARTIRNRNPGPTTEKL